MMLRKTRNPPRKKGAARGSRLMDGREEFGCHPPLAWAGFMAPLPKAPGDGFGRAAPLPAGTRSLQSAGSAWGLDAAPDNGPGFISSRILG